MNRYPRFILSQLMVFDMISAFDENQMSYEKHDELLSTKGIHLKHLSLPLSALKLLYFLSKFTACFLPQLNHKIFSGLNLSENLFLIKLDELFDLKILQYLLKTSIYIKFHDFLAQLFLK